MACDQLILNEFFLMLKRDKQASSLQDYVELSVMLEYNSSKLIYDFISKMRLLCSIMLALQINVIMLKIMPARPKKESREPAHLFFAEPDPRKKIARLLVHILM